MLRTSGNAIHASGVVGYESDGFTRDQMGVALSEMSGDIDLHLYSAGGSVKEGHSIYNQLAAYPGKVTCHVDSFSASIATVIQCAADKVVATANATFMVHGPSAVAMGGATDLRRLADQLDQFKQDAAMIYAKRSGKPVQFWIDQQEGDDNYYNAQQAASMGLVDEVLGGVTTQQHAADTVAQVVQATQLMERKGREEYQRRVLDRIRRMQ